MNCQKVRENLSAYLDGELNKAEASSLAAHLLTCNNCRQEWEQLKMINALWQELPEIEPPPNFMQGLSEKLAAATAETAKPPLWERARRITQRPWYKFAAVAAVFGMALGISTLLDNEKVDVLNHPQVTKAPNIQTGKPHEVKSDGETAAIPEEQQQKTEHKTPTQKDQAVDGKKDEQQLTPPQTQQVAVNNPKSAPAAQTESVEKANTLNAAANVSTLSIKITVPSKDIPSAGQKVFDVAAKYNAQLSEKDNEFDLKFPLGTDISLLLDEFKAIGEVSTVPFKDITKEYRSEIKELEQRKAELQNQLEGDARDKDKIQQELNNVQNAINAKYDEIKELSKYVNIIVKLAS